jgi:predicted RNA-binding protein Jag
MSVSLEKIAQQFFEKLSIEFSDLKVQEEAEHIYGVSLQTPDSALLIWPHGKNLETITHLLKLLFAKASSSHVHIHLEVNDYLAKKDEKLLAFIETKIQQVQNSGKEVILPYLTSYERKKVHSYVSEHSKNVYTQSRWEWENRRIHLCKKDIVLTLDIDGDDI